MPDPIPVPEPEPEPDPTPEPGDPAPSDPVDDPAPPPEDTPPSQDHPVPPPARPAKEVRSSDGKLSIHIGGDGDAYLYDTTRPGSEPRFLGSDVIDAVFVVEYIPNSDPATFTKHPYIPVVKAIQLTLTDGTKRTVNIFGFSTNATFQTSAVPAVSARGALQKKMQGSAALQTLKSGFSW